MPDIYNSLTVEDLDIRRDGSGRLIPVKTSTSDGLSVRIIPATYGDIYRFTNMDEDIESDLPVRAVNNHVVTPDFVSMSLEEVKGNLTPESVQSLFRTILKKSGVKMPEEREEGDALEEELKRLEDDPHFEYILHEFGYSYIGDRSYYKLTIAEIKRLLEGNKLHNSENMKESGGKREPTAKEMAAFKRYEAKKK